MANLFKRAAQKIKSELHENLGVGEAGLGDLGRAIQRAKRNPLQELATQAEQAANPIVRAVGAETLAKSLGGAVGTRDQSDVAPMREVVRSGAKTVVNVGGLLIPAARIPKAVQLANPAARLIGSGLIRGAESAGYGLANRAIEGQGLKQNISQVPKDIAFGAFLNTVLSPKLTKEASIQVVEDFHNLLGRNARSMATLPGSYGGPKAEYFQAAPNKFSSTSQGIPVKDQIVRFDDRNTPAMSEIPYHWYSNKDNKFIPAIRPKKVDLGSGVDAFIQKTPEGKGWQVVEGKTGTVISDISHPSQNEAIEKAKIKIDEYLESTPGETIDNLINRFTDSVGVSPRYNINPGQTGLPNVAPKKIMLNQAERLTATGQELKPSLLARTANTKVGRLFTSGKAGLKIQGKAGEELADLGVTARREAQSFAGQLQAELQDALRPLKKDERVMVTGVLEGKLKKTGIPAIDEAAQRIRVILDTVAERAQAVGLEIKTPDGVHVPFKPRENYFPRHYNLDELTKAQNREKLLTHLVDSGQAQNLADADRIFENFIKGQTERIHGNLEKARIADLPGYELDPLKAVDQYIKGASKRLSEVKYFGSKDEIAKDIIEQVRLQGGDYKYAQEVFDHITGKKDFTGDSLNKIADVTAKFDILSKLDLSFVTNATQPVNTGTKFGILRTLNSVLKAYAQPYKSGNYARKVGAITDDIARQDTGVRSTILDAIMTPFTFVERKNRTSAALAAADFTKSVAEKLAQNPANRTAIRQMRSLGLAPEKIIAQGGPTPDDILQGAKVGSDTTQFQIDALEIPPAWKTPIGRILARFKSFTFKQQQFLRDEVYNEAVHGNFTPLMRLLALGVPASYLSYKGRNILAGRDEKDEKSGGLDVRELDKWFKAIGFYPLELVTQAHFLKKTYDSPYASDLRKIGRTAGTLFGPTVGDTFKLVDAFESASRIKRDNKNVPKGKLPSDPYLDLKRFAAGSVPIVGEQIKNRLLAYPEDNVSDFTRVIRALESGDGEALDKALSTYKQSSRKQTLKRAEEALQKEGKEIPELQYPSTIKDKANAAETTPTTSQSSADNPYDSIKDASLARAKFNQDVRRLRADKDTKVETVVETYKDRIDDLSRYMRSLDPKLDQSAITRTLTEIEKLTEAVQKYNAQGGFKAPKKSKSVKVSKGKRTKSAKGSKALKVKVYSVKVKSVKVPKANDLKVSLPKGVKRGRRTQTRIRIAGRR